MPIRLLIADDHGVVRQGLRMFLSTDPEIEIVGEARDGSETVDLARELRPDVVLLDLLMPVMDGIEATKIIRRELPRTEVVALTSVMEDGTIIDAIRAGAIAYLLKDTESQELRRAVKSAAAGQVQLSPAVAARLASEFRSSAAPLDPLTDREAEVLALLARGKSNKEISTDLGISEQTVKSHVSHILKKLGLPSRTHAAIYSLHGKRPPP